jgi:hypothetical protein
MHVHKWGRARFQAKKRGQTFRVCVDRKCRAHRLSTGNIYTFNDFC